MTLFDQCLAQLSFAQTTRPDVRSSKPSKKQSIVIRQNVEPNIYLAQSVNDTALSHNGRCTHLKVIIGFEFCCSHSLLEQSGHIERSRCSLSTHRPSSSRVYRLSAATAAFVSELKIILLLAISTPGISLSLRPKNVPLSSLHRSKYHREAHHPTRLRPNVPA